MSCDHEPCLTPTGFICNNCGVEIGCCVHHCRKWLPLGELVVVDSVYRCADAKQEPPEAAVQQPL